MKAMRGFSLIEILIAIALVGLLATVVVPNLTQRRAHYDRKQFVSTLNALVTLAWEHAIMHHKVHRVWFDLQNNTIQVQIDTGKKDFKGVSEFKIIDSDYLSPLYIWDDSLHVKDFFIEGEDEIHKHAVAQKVWFFIVPEGLTQDVIINIFDVKDTSQSEAGTQLSLVLNPFTAKFVQYGTFQYP